MVVVDNDATNAEVDVDFFEDEDLTFLAVDGVAYMNPNNWLSKLFIYLSLPLFSSFLPD